MSERFDHETRVHDRYALFDAPTHPPRELARTHLQFGTRILDSEFRSFRPGNVIPGFESRAVRAAALTSANLSELLC